MRAKCLPWVLATMLFSAMPVTPAAHAADLTAREVMQEAEASMVVPGTVTITPEGAVAGYQLDNPGELPGAVNNLLQQAIPGWRFEPIVHDGRAAFVKSRMSLRVVLHPLGDKRFRLYVASAYFGTGDHSSKSALAEIRQPRYPRDAVREHVSGTVYVAMKVDAKGHPLDVAAAQVDLRVALDEHEMERFRKMFADASVEAARSWIVDPQLLGAAGGEHVVMIPVNFQVVDRPGALHSRPDRPDNWDIYVPGPRQQIPWLDTEQALSGGADALPNEGLFVLDQAAPRLKSKLGGV